METGGVDNAITLPPHIDPLLEEAALRAVHKWRFKPGARTLEVPIEFKLEA
jgi:TonB family protein